ncbi:MAG: peptide ABC transporter permease [SAR116 cluster bacterium]|jgi:peptide/nickel transport system permease protein|nr:peptide ABC transporter permease [SAR116 cluster bacterium]RCL78326.1 MAG: ABC transporter permease [SAR116 cluster bacterium]CAI8357543.1 MAG: Glutathione transport system permease protein GsiC [SAR116 cluster bacterium]|tara:strand:- start:1228 stop:2184 length:957 start_codon:yes stop_codon:yes gene_type:complete
MLSYAIRRILLTIPTLIAVAVLVFFVLRVVPGDIVEIKLTAEGGMVSEEEIMREKERLGLNDPIMVQFYKYMIGLPQGDLGISLWTENSVSSEIAARIGLSFELAILSTVLAVLIAFPLGTLSALFRGSILDYVIRLLTIGGIAVPSFWLGMLIIMMLLATVGQLPPLGTVGLFEDPLTNLNQLIWPALSVGYRYSSVTARMLRSSILEVLSEDYIRTARAKGVFERIVIVKHGMRNALLPTVTVIGLEFAFLLGGLVVTESVFNLNGIGKLFVDSVVRNDLNLLQGLVLTVATGFVLINLIVDLLYAALDPRIRYQK